MGMRRKYHRVGFTGALMAKVIARFPTLIRLLFVIPAVLLGGCAVSPNDAVRDSATAIQIARSQCGDEGGKWHAMLSGDYWVLWSDKLLEVQIAKRDGAIPVHSRTTLYVVTLPPAPPR